MCVLPVPMSKNLILHDHKICTLTTIANLTNPLTLMRKDSNVDTTLVNLINHQVCPYSIVRYCHSTHEIYFLPTDNVALNKPAEQPGTSQSTPYATAGKAVDGDLNPNMDWKSCVNVKRTGNKPAWWLVDLEQEYDIAQVTIYTRTKYKSMNITL